jgi:predicted transcriptional regulator
MPKTASLPPVRVEPELRDALQRIGDETGVSVYELTRQAVAEYVARQLRVGVPASRLMTVADGESLGVIPS